MLHISLPGATEFRLTHLVCDLNGTLAVDGQMSESVRERLIKLSEQLQIHVVSADTHGTLEQIAASLQEAGISVRTERVSTGAGKVAYVRALGAGEVVAVGNGVNDVGMFRIVRLSIAVCWTEGLAQAALQIATLLTPSPEAALDLLLYPSRLIATLRP